MKKVFLVCVAVIALVGVDIDSAAIEQSTKDCYLASGNC